MKKKSVRGIAIPFLNINSFRKMKLIVLFAVVSLLQLTAAQSHAQEAKIDLQLSGVTLEEAIKTVEKNTNYVFFLNHSDIDLNQKVNVNAHDAEIKEVLKQMFVANEYRIENNKIVVLPATTQQDNRITGTVLDELGEPVIGANVVEKGTTNGTITNIDGEFSLNVPTGAVLSITYIGYHPTDITVTANRSYTVQLKEDTQTLDEVVVVGYGIQKKVNVVGSIATVDSKQLENRPQSSVVSTLTGQMPGVTITQAGGRPGEHTGTIRVRGVGSFGATPDALILIDGIPGNMSDINPNDIAAISILKDASTAAIYGARAANGVVLVTTKTGQEGRLVVNYSGYAGFNKATALPEFVNSWEYATLLNKAEGITRFTDEEIQAMRDGSRPDEFANEKYTDDLFRTGFQTGHDLSITGGTDKSHYMASFGYLNQDAILQNNNFTRYNARLNLTSQLSDKLKMTIRLRGDKSRMEEPFFAGSVDSGSDVGNRLPVFIMQSMRFPGYRPSVLSDGSWGPGVKNFGTPKSWLASDAFYERPIMRMEANAQFEYKPVKGLTLMAMGAYNYTNRHEKWYRATLPVKVNDQINVLGPSSLEEKNINREYKTFQATADYSITLNDAHYINVLAGYSWEDESERDMDASRQNFPGNNLPHLSAGSPDTQLNSGGGYDWVIQSFFGRLQYNYKERYLLEGTVRYDGSSRFPVNERYGLFPSAAAGWRLSEESFIRDNEKLSFIDQLKLKASIGILGNNNIGNYAYQSVYNLGAANNYPIGMGMAQGARLTTYTDPNLKWETTRTTDFGVESILWNGLLSFNASYFYRYTYDILYKPNASVSSIFGLNLSEVNTGEVSNRGWEFEIGHQNRIGNVSYGVNGNFTIIRNRVETLGVGDVELANGMVGNGSDLFVGHPMQGYYGYKTDGVFVDQADIDAWFAQTDQSAMGSNKANTRPGDIRYLDISGPDGVPDGKVDPTYDRVYLGSKFPKYNFGLSLNAAYKGFDMNVLFQGVAGVKGMLSNYAGWALFSEGNIQKWQMDEAFDEANPIRYPGYPRITNLGNTTGVNNQTSDFWVRNASYLRLKNIQLGYTLPKKLLAKTFISNVRIYASAENPYTWHHYPKGWDPETKTGGDYYPFMSTYTFGLNVKF